MAECRDRNRPLARQRQCVAAGCPNAPHRHAGFAGAGKHHIEVTTPQYPLEQADRALSDLSAGRIAGAAVLLV